MTFLPIVARELRVAARRRSTFRIRSWTAVAAIALASMWLMMASLGPSRAGVGRTVFEALTVYAFGLSLLAGVFLTADSLSEEKREGTLGLLFLTDLKGYDVVLGKFMATSLNAFYALLALLPVAALPLLLGGVSGGEFWRTTLALVNALFFSLATGICVSAVLFDSQGAISGTLSTVAVLTAAPPLLASFIGWVLFEVGWLAWLSPYGAFAHASEVLYVSHAGDFWGSLLVSHLLAWTLIVLASLVVPYRWQERAIRPSGLLARWSQSRSSRECRARRRAELLPQNPVMWLMSGENRFRWGLWLVVLAWAGLMLATMVLSSASELSQVGWPMVIVFGFLLKALFALQASRFFADARRSGALELLLCTPLRSHEIVKGQASALWRSLRWPLVVFFLVLFLPYPAHVFQALRQGDWGQVPGSVGMLVLSVFYALRLLADLAAICWVGMWLGLSAKKPALAPAQTILFVLILPSVLCWLDFIAALVLMAWASGKLNQDLRRLLTEQYQPVFVTAGQGEMKAPPVIRNA